MSGRTKVDLRTAKVEAAAGEWIEAKRRLEAVKDADAKLKKAAAVLKDWFRETGHSSIEVLHGTVGYSLSFSTVLDQEAIKAHLGKKIHAFEKQQQRETLTLLGERSSS